MVDSGWWDQLVKRKCRYLEFLADYSISFSCYFSSTRIFFFSQWPLSLSLLTTPSLFFFPPSLYASTPLLSLSLYLCFTHTLSLTNLLTDTTHVPPLSSSLSHASTPLLSLSLILSHLQIYSLIPLMCPLSRPLWFSLFTTPSLSLSLTHQHHFSLSLFHSYSQTYKFTHWYHSCLHSLSLFLSLSLSLILSHLQVHSLIPLMSPLSRPLSLSSPPLLSLSLSFLPSLTHQHPFSLFFTHTHTLTGTLTDTTHVFPTLSLLHSLSLSLSLSHTHTQNFLPFKEHMIYQLPKFKCLSRNMCNNWSEQHFLIFFSIAKFKFWTAKEFFGGKQCDRKIDENFAQFLGKVAKNVKISALKLNLKVQNTHNKPFVETACLGENWSSKK